MLYATFDDLRNEIADEIKVELIALGQEPMPSDDVIGLKVKDAMREAIRDRNYPDGYSETRMLADIEKFYINIKAKAFCKINQIGMEFETSHTENGFARTFIEYQKLSQGINPIARIM